MSTGLLAVDATVTLTQAAAQMDARRVGAALVMNGEHLSGILTERDILHAVATGVFEGTRVGAWMTHDPETVAPDDRPGHAAAIMLRGGFRHLPVLDGDKPIGIVSIRDLMRIALDDESRVSPEAAEGSEPALNL
jgi:CBS domain-containing protein